jgi:hypothetical protein
MGKEKARARFSGAGFSLKSFDSGVEHPIAAQVL